MKAKEVSLVEKNESLVVEIKNLENSSSTALEVREEAYGFLLSLMVQVY